MNKYLQWAISRILARLEKHPNFYGKVTISFQNGKATHVSYEDGEKYEGQ